MSATPHGLKAGDERFTLTPKAHQALGTTGSVRMADAITKFIENEVVITGDEHRPVAELYADEISVDTLVAFLKSEGITWTTAFGEVDV